MKNYLIETEQDSEKSAKKSVGGVAVKEKGVIFAAANEGNEGDEKRGGLRTYIEIMEWDVAIELKQ